MSFRQEIKDLRGGDRIPKIKFLTIIRCQIERIFEMQIAFVAINKKPLIFPIDQVSIEIGYKFWEITCVIPENNWREMCCHGRRFVT